MTHPHEEQMGVRLRDPRSMAVGPGPSSLECSRSHGASEPSQLLNLRAVYRTLPWARREDIRIRGTPGKVRRHGGPVVGYGNDETEIRGGIDLSEECSMELRRRTQTALTDGNLGSASAESVGFRAESVWPRPLNQRADSDSDSDSNSRVEFELLFHPE
ncbi:hypothetical protein BO71DRAFT_72928 [Aspergillus ellipticus CBS 707.79]|uniref:Uncharacterized protein n=1 Tax=Aspergillus ellipticus CBS 707.79 TaxID=1448320 RepID=A0A319CYZ6_9EURO|nr:hypothetical protein BO71DRAFT_72928 [Aspergillus ellipticus CBS 707.79]